MSLTFYIGKLICLFLEAHRGINVMLYVVPFGPVSEEVIQRLIFLTQHLSQDSGCNCCWEFVDDFFWSQKVDVLLLKVLSCISFVGYLCRSLPLWFVSQYLSIICCKTVIHDAESFACFRILLIKIAIFPETPRYLLNNEILLHFHVVVWGQGLLSTSSVAALTTKFAPSFFGSASSLHVLAGQNKMELDQATLFSSNPIPTHLVTTIPFDRFFATKYLAELDAFRCCLACQAMAVAPSAPCLVMLEHQNHHIMRWSSRANVLPIPRQGGNKKCAGEMWVINSFYHFPKRTWAVWCFRIASLTWNMCILADFMCSSK